MATKKQNRGTSGHSEKRRGGAALAIFLAILAIAAIVVLILEFCTPYNPSNGFKKEQLPTEQTDPIPEKSGSKESAQGAITENIGTEHTAGKNRSYASTYESSPGCYHVQQMFVSGHMSVSGNQIGLSADSSYSFNMITCSGSFQMCIFSRNSGELILSLDNCYIAQAYSSSPINSVYYNYTAICCHNFRDQCAAEGYQFDNVEFVNNKLNFIGTNNPTAVYYSYDNYSHSDRLCIEFFYIDPSASRWSPLDSVGGNKYHFEADVMQNLPPDPVKEGYTFTGWYTDEACTNPYEGDMVTEDITLYAGWQINTYTLTLNGNGGELSKSSVSGNYNTVPTIPTPTRTGYTFTGWQTADGQAYNVSNPLTQDLTLTAQWQIKTYTLTLNGNGGELSQSSVSGDYNTVPTIPTPMRTGYTFTGWQKADGQAYNVFAPLTRNLSLTAGWQINTYTLTLNGNGGELPQSSVSGEYNTVPAIPTPTRTGYTFTGWKTADGQVYNVESPLTQDLTLTAQWQIKTYTVTFIVDGIVYETMTVDYGTKLVHITESVEPTLFALYSLDEAGASLASDYALDGDITVYAEKGSKAQQVKGNWKKIAIGGACGAVLIAFVCCIPAMVSKIKKKR